MYLISFKDNQFYIDIKVSSEFDEGDYQSEIDYLKYHYIFYSDRKWKIPTDKIQELIMWFDRDHKDYSITDSCANEFERIQNSYKREVDFFRNRKLDESILNQNVELKNFQKHFVNWRLQRSAYLDCHDAGTGKTIQEICTFSQLYKDGFIDGIIILAPIGLSYHWEREILSKVNIFKKSDIQIIDNLLKVKPFDKFTDKSILIIRHDLYADCIASYNKNYSSNKSLKDLKWKTADYVDIKAIWKKKNIFVCLDEGHGFKNTSAIKTKAIFSTKKYFDYRAYVSATPWINGVEDSYAPLTFIDHSIIPMSENAFKLWISTSIGNRFDRYAINEYNSNNVQKLMQSYQHVLTQVRKEDLDEIKTIKHYKDIQCEIIPKQFLLYRKIVEQELRVMQEEYDEITWKLLLTKLHLILEVFDNPLLLTKRQYDDSEIHSILDSWKIEEDSKFIYLKNRLEDLIDYQGKKVVVYDTHPMTIELLSQKFKKYNPLIIHGNLKVKNKDLDRQEKEDLFNYNDSHKLIILSAFTSSQGINLQHGSSNIIFYSLPFDATLVKQGQERTDRVTSTGDSIIEYLYYPESIDSYRYNVVVNRMEFNRNIDQVLTQDDINRLLNGSYSN